MKKVKLFISFLLFLLFTSSQSQVKAECSSKAQDIPVYKKGKFSIEVQKFEGFQAL